MSKRSKVYTIGEVSQICDLSKKALRYYDEIGLIKSVRDHANNYRYYSYDSLLAVPVIKYYKQSGFRLDEMKKFLVGSTDNVYRDIQMAFQDKIRELEDEKELIRRKHASVSDWHDMIIEAEMVIANDIRNVGVKFVKACDLLFFNQEFVNDIKDSIINIEFTNFVNSVDNEITGPVMIQYSSYKDRMAYKDQPIRMLQQTLMPCQPEHATRFGGCMMVACYHIGPHETIGVTYQKIVDWAQQNGYQLGRDSCERYVADYWTTSNAEQFVTEILIEINRA